MSAHSSYSSRRRRFMFTTYVGFLCLWSISFLLMPLSSSSKEKSFLLFLPGLSFWIGLLGTIVTAFYINIRRKRSFRFNALYPDMKKIGVVHFFQNQWAVVFDITLFVSIIGYVIAKIYIRGLTIQFIFLSLFAFSFGMHCMLNGICYEYINYKNRRVEKS